jgi:hypothetical protein
VHLQRAAYLLAFGVRWRVKVGYEHAAGNKSTPTSLKHEDERERERLGKLKWRFRLENLVLERTVKELGGLTCPNWDAKGFNNVSVWKIYVKRNYRAKRGCKKYWTAFYLEITALTNPDFEIQQKRRGKKLDIEERGAIYTYWRA